MSLERKDEATTATKPFVTADKLTCFQDVREFMTATAELANSPEELAHGLAPMIEALKRLGVEPNFPGYAVPAGTTPGQRKGFTPEQLALIERVRQARRDFVALLHEAGNTLARPDEPPRMGSADLTMALRHMEDAEYRTIRHITGGPT